MCNGYQVFTTEVLVTNCNPEKKMTYLYQKHVPLYFHTSIMGSAITLENGYPVCKNTLFLNFEQKIILIHNYTVHPK